MINGWAYTVGFILFFFAAFTKGILGFGVNIVAVPILSLFVGPKMAIAMSTLPSVINNLIIVWQWRDQNSPRLLKRISPLIVTGALGITLGTVLLVSLRGEVIQAGLGIMTIAYVLTEKLRQNWQIQPHQERILAAPTGFVAGLLGGISGITGPILVAYFHSLRLEKRAFVYAISTIFFVFTVVQSINLFLLGVYTPEIALLCFSYIIPLALGTKLGGIIQTKISQSLFNRLLLITLFITGLDLIRRGFGWF